MNNGIVSQNLSLNDPFGDLPKGLLGVPTVINMPYYYPPNTDWSINNNNLVLVFDTRLTFSRSQYGTIQVPSTTIYLQVSTTVSERVIIDWGDGSTTILQGANFGTQSHTYPSHGIYTVQIFSIGQFSFGTSANLLDARALTKCLSFGNNIRPLGAAYTFAENINLIECPESIPTGITSINNSFRRCSNFNSPKISDWNTSNITDMSVVFLSCINFNQPLYWNTSKVTNMQNMFNSCTSFQGQGLENWDVSGVTVMSDMFSNCSNFNADLGLWDVRNLRTLPTMFGGCVSFIGSGLSDWQLRPVGTIQNMFLSCRSLGSGLPINLSNWNVTGATSLLGMFNGCTSLTNLTISGWNIGPGASCTTIFANANISGAYLPNWTFTSGNNCSQMFYSVTSPNICNMTNVSGLSTWNTVGMTSMASMFDGGGGARTIGMNSIDSISNWNTSNVTSMNKTFAFQDQSTSFNQPLYWNVGKVTDFGGMFASAQRFAGSGLETWNVTGVATDMSSMFSSATNLRNVIMSGWYGANGCNHTSQFQSANISGSYLSDWRFTSGNNCNTMFNAANLANVSGFDSWNTSGIISTINMFGNATNFSGSGLENWNTSNITNMNQMFSNSSFGLNNTGINLSGWNVSKVTNMGQLFQSTNFKGYGLETWNLAGLSGSTTLFNFAFGCTFPSGQYDLILNSWNNNKSSGVNGVANWRTDLSPHFGNSKYTAAGSGARAALTAYGWTITDGGLQT